MLLLERPHLALPVVNLPLRGGTRSRGASRIAVLDIDDKILFVVSHAARLRGRGLLPVAERAGSGINDAPLYSSYRVALRFAACFLVPPDFPAAGTSTGPASAGLGRMVMP